jgi:multicomponent Na+:H+ antiporter subunit E
MKTVILGIGLLAVWLTVTSDLDAPTVVIGVVLTLLGIVQFRGLIHGERWIGRPERIGAVAGSPRRYLARVLFLFLFAPVFAWKVFVSAVQLAALSLKPNLDFWPGIVRVKGGFRSLTATTVFANLVTLTPGTLTMDYDQDNDDLYVHWIDVTDYGDVTFDDRVTGGLRRWVRRILE